MDDRTAILNLIYSYSRNVDSGDFDAVGQLFAEGAYEIPSVGVLPGTGIGDMFARRLRRYEDGTPKTTHVNPNVILEIDEPNGRATAWTSVLVFQLIEERIECIFSGWYDDEFERVEGRWIWIRRVANPRFMGDMSRHVVPEPESV
jgi:hypothetical protein